jgi:hypothetical protein
MTAKAGSEVVGAPVGAPVDGRAFEMAGQAWVASSATPSTTSAASTACPTMGTPCAPSQAALSAIIAARLSGVSIARTSSDMASGTSATASANERHSFSEPSMRATGAGVVLQRTPSSELAKAGAARHRLSRMMMALRAFLRGIPDVYLAPLGAVDALPVPEDRPPSAWYEAPAASRG